MAKPAIKIKLFQSLLVAALGVATAAVIIVSGIIVLGKTNFDISMLSPAPNVGTVLTNPRSEDIFNKAIENHLSTTFIKQTFDQTITVSEGKTMSLRASAISDFTKPETPLTAVNYTLSSSDPADTETAKMFNRDQIAIGQNLYAKIPSNVTIPNSLFKTNQWYALTSTSTFAQRFMFDMFGIGSSVNMPYGQVIVGNFSSEHRKEIMKHIETHKTYAPGQGKAEDLDGKRVIHYTVSVEHTKLTALNDFTATKLGTKNNFKVQEVDKLKPITFEAWVDYTTKRLVKVHISRNNSPTNVESSLVTFDYPTNITPITAPTDAIPLSTNTNPSTRT